MNSKILVFLCSVVVLFVVGCGNSNSNTAGTPTTATCATSAQNNTNKVLFGDPGGGDTTRISSSDTMKVGCNRQGICDAVSADPSAILVGFRFTQGTGTNPSTLVMMFPYATLFQKQPELAMFFYNNAPVATYQFLTQYPLKNLGGNFANVCESIMPTAAGAGAITYSPPLAAPFPANAAMASTVTVTFNVSQ